MARAEKQKEKAAKREQRKDEDRPTSGPEIMSLEEAEALRS